MSEAESATTEPIRSDWVKQKQAKPHRFLSLRDVLDRLTISRSLLYELIKDPKRPFPSPVHLGRRSVWVEGEVEAYMRETIAIERSLNRESESLQTQMERQDRYL